MQTIIWKRCLLIISIALVAIASSGCEGNRASDTSALIEAQQTAGSSPETLMPSSSIPTAEPAVTSTPTSIAAPAVTSSPTSAPAPAVTSSPKVTSIRTEVPLSDNTELKADQKLEVQSDFKPSQGAAGKVDKQQLAVDCGKLAFEKEGGTANVQLPLICIRASYGVDDLGHPITIAPREPLKAVSYSILAELHDQLAAYWMNFGDNVHGVLLLAPKGWKVISGAVGANGSSAVRLENPKDPQQFITYMDSGGCQGCIIANIGAYFPEMHDWAEKQGFTPDPVADMKKQTLLNPNLMTYSKKSPIDGYELNGIAYQEHGEGGGTFRMQEVQLPAANHGLARAMLNLFVALNPGAAQ
ncbi:DUF4850 domain-containing protein [Paenibacillus sp. LMG 31456]|uniref:DUF4850 domain-containing protein n=1 Tax=Paenibacillus foliorum TaxID=2654974 RepID=A0A972H0A4_9BACL|nr:DUF4850 domain-containing protein [Paenibacillus foliorum]NOU97443.1 DUF4850 domain-containing protein [Paenibacillus foliorum]